MSEFWEILVVCEWGYVETDENVPAFTGWDDGAKEAGFWLMAALLAQWRRSFPFAHLFQRKIWWGNESVCLISLPTSNSNPLFSKVCVHPPAWSCCSRTRTLFPALAKRAAAVRPPTPLPITTASRAAGTRSTRKPAHRYAFQTSTWISERFRDIFLWKNKCTKLLVTDSTFAIAHIVYIRTFIIFYAVVACVFIWLSSIWLSLNYTF